MIVVGLEDVVVCCWLLCVVVDLFVDVVVLVI